MNPENTLLLLKTVQYRFTIWIILSVCLFYETAAFILPNRFDNKSSPLFFYVRHVLKSVPLPVMLSKPLIFDGDMDGHMDVFNADLTGRIHGVLNFQCIVKRCKFEKWSVVVPHHGFASSPVVIPVDRRGNSLVVFISHQGGVFAFDSLGRMNARLQIPKLVVRLIQRDKDLSISSSSLSLGSRSIENISWLFHDQHVDPPADVTRHSAGRRIYHLRPHVSVDAVHHIEPQPTSSTVFVAQSDLGGRLKLLIPVTFTDTAHRSTVHLAAIVSLSLRALLGGDPRSAATDHRPLTPGLQIHVLEVTEASTVSGEHQPTLLTSQPVIVTTASKRDLDASNLPSGFPADKPVFNHSLLVTTSTGHLHRVAIPLVDTTSISRSKSSHQVWDLGRVPLAQSCYPVECPRSTVAPGSSSNLCCLLLDASSRLRLVDLTQPPTGDQSRGSATDHSRDSAADQSPGSFPGHVHVHWQYHGGNSSKSDIGGEPAGEISLVHACPLRGSNRSVCPHRWAVFSTHDGRIHAVDVANGLSAPGFPIWLFTPPASTPSGEADQLTGISPASNQLTSMSLGSGQLTIDADGSPWLVFSDTNGQLYHVDVLKTRVRFGSVCTNHLTSCHLGRLDAGGSLAPSTVVVVPVPRVVKVSEAGAQPPTSISLLVWDQGGLQLLVMSDSQGTVGGGPRVTDGISLLLFSAPLLDIWLAQLPVPSRFDMQLQLHYRLPTSELSVSTGRTEQGGNHTSNAEALLPSSASRVRLLDLTGLPLSDWSSPAAASATTSNCTPKSTAVDSGPMRCGSLLVTEVPGDGPVRPVSHAVLLLLQGRGDLLWMSGSPLQLSLGCSSGLGAEAAQAQSALLIATYLPGVFLLFGLSAFHLLTEGWMPGTDWYHHRGSRLLRSV